MVSNAIDPQTKGTHSVERIKNALDQSKANITNAPVEQQIESIVDAMRTIIPISLETKDIKVTIPAIHTGKAYGIINQYKQKENWLDDGSLEVVIKIPTGLVMGFYDKLNGVTHGSALTEELQEEKTNETNNE